MTQAALLDTGEATFSEDGRHRYTLARRIGPGERSVLFVMLNPSTADASVDDPTVRRCIGFARTWGFARLDVANLFSLRSTDPKALYPHPEEATGDPVNSGAIAMLASEARLVVCAWGVHGAIIERGAFVRRLLVGAGAKPRHLGLTKEGHPKHPLYLASSTKPAPWGAS